MNLLLSKIDNKYFRRLILLLISFILLFISINFNSRSFILGYLFAIIILICLSYNLSKKVFFTLFTVWTAVFLTLTICFKPDSSSGRLLIYKISYHIFKSHINGIGFGNFPKYYMQFQERYFHDNNWSVKELLLADNTKYAFNDYLQYIVEFGILGIVLLLILSLIIILIFKKVKNNQDFVQHFLFAQLIAILIAACFTSILHQQLFIFYFLGVTILLGFLILKEYVQPSLSLLPISLILLAFAGIGTEVLKSYKAKSKLDYVKELYFSGFKRESEVELKSMYNDHNTDTDYLKLYASVLADRKFNQQAKEILLRVASIEPNGDVYNRLGQLNETLGNSDQAQQNFIKSIYMVPNRLLPRYNLFKIYLKKGDTAKAIPVGKTILKMPIKVSSAYVSQLKNEVRLRMLVDKLM